MKFIQAVIILVLCAVSCLLYAFFIERHNVKVENLSITSKKLPADFAGLRLVHISDLHLNRLTDYERTVAQKVNSLNPDVIVITGDFFKQRDDFEGDNARTVLPQTIQQIQEFLRLLQAKHGIYITRGNNDFSNDKEVSDIFLDAMHEDETTILVNSTKTLNIDGQRIHLMGVDYPGFSRWEANEFEVRGDSSNFYLSSWFSFKNSYSHVLVNDERERWQDYTYSGRFRQVNPDESGVGITFYSQFDRGYDQYYRLRRLAGWTRFVLSPHGVKQLEGETSFEFKVKTHQWYQFKVECTQNARGNRMRVKLWTEGTAEPDEWLADAVDTTARFDNGTIGLWSHGKDRNHFDDVCVLNAAGDTLFFDDFEDGDSFGWIDFNFEGKAVPVLKKSLPDSEFTILLAHAPDIVPWAASARIDLQLSGHTHGGQVKIPLIGPIAVGTKMGRKYHEGLFQFDQTTLYINRGLGTVLLPIRFLSRPEIAVIDVRGE
jgi:predicted MPP superfamily phosphohydrolase